jgi:hypothetical protein
LDPAFDGALSTLSKRPLKPPALTFFTRTLPRIVAASNERVRAHRPFILRNPRFSVVPEKYQLLESGGRAGLPEAAPNILNYCGLFSSNVGRCVAVLSVSARPVRLLDKD